MHECLLAQIFRSLRVYCYIRLTSLKRFLWRAAGIGLSVCKLPASSYLNWAWGAIGATLKKLLDRPHGKRDRWHTPEKKRFFRFISLALEYIQSLGVDDVCLVRVVIVNRMLTILRENGGVIHVCIRVHKLVLVVEPIMYFISQRSGTISSSETLPLGCGIVVVVYRIFVHELANIMRGIASLKPVIALVSCGSKCHASQGKHPTIYLLHPNWKIAFSESEFWKAAVATVWGRHIGNTYDWERDRKVCVKCID